MSKRRIQCLFLEPIGKAQVSLRRYCGFNKSDEVRKCPGKMSYHNASIPIGVIQWSEDEGMGADDFPHDDPQWPTHCECGYEFDEEDNWQQNRNRLYGRSDNGEFTTIGDSPLGSMWYADWMPKVWRGPDGRTLIVRTPGGDWPIDGPATNSKKVPGWTRSGEPPNITARPSIGMGEAGTPEYYHAWLTNGELVDC